MVGADEGSIPHRLAWYTKTKQSPRRAGAWNWHAMNKSNPTWEAVIVLFAVAVTATTMLAYRLMITYNISIPWFVWVLIVVLCAVFTLGPKLIRRQPKQ